jgi:hypothetical protein
MRTPSHFGFFLRSAATVALFAGCSGGGSQFPAANAPVSPLGQSVGDFQPSGIHDSSPNMLPPSMRQSNAAPTHQAAFVNVAGVNALHGNQTIVSDAFNNTVSVYGANGKRTALLTASLKGPHGLATDAAETLYVANTQDFNVLVYAKPYRSAGLTLDDSGQFPTGVAVSNTGIVGVTNLIANPYAPGNVRLYAKGSTSACATVSDPNWNGMYFGAFDSSGNLFIDGTDRNGNTLVGEVSGGCGATSVTTLSLGAPIYLAGGVQVYNGNVLIEDQKGPGCASCTNTPIIYTYAPPVAGSLGQPIATTPLTAGTDPVTFAMTKFGGYLWIAHSGIAAGRMEYTYPSGRFVKSIDDSSYVQPAGIAVNPAAIPR